jgi:phosphatidylglycerophosphate synthase
VNRTRFPLWHRVLAEEGELKLANLVTVLRVVLIVPIILLLLVGLNGVALGLNMVAAGTDLVDGWLARREGRASGFGAQLDAFADNLFSLAILGCLLLAYPDLASRHGPALVILFGVPLIYIVVSYLLRQRVLMFHFWSAKIGALMLFSLWPLIALTQSEMWIPITAAVVGLSRLEQLIYILRGGFDLNAHHGLGSTSHKYGMDTTIP